MKLHGRGAIITGGSAGLGYSVASTFLANGANVAICGRNSDRLSEACRRLSASAMEDQRVMAAPCDVSNEEQVYGFVGRAIEELGEIQILINNAGVLGPVGRTDEVSLDEWRQTIETNLNGVLLPTRALLPHLRSRHYGKIVNLSGGGATSPRPFFSAYAVSKAAVIRLTENLAEELAGAGIDVNAIAPGALNTRMLTQIIAAGPDRIGHAQFSQVMRQQETGGASLERAAELCVYLGSSASDGITGKLISAPWDPWPELHRHLPELQGSDVYTLRRIVPEDRGKTWN
jgi:NAD(P)-dependent dehydrogenase (short-subunit alcohol dehydrogenase family)